ncbi:MAG: hypothetical protein L0Z68_09380 [Gammaproteobacteria bacterium]|nr:hypothetical protein [Gammaproteobacteria bacterium]
MFHIARPSRGFKTSSIQWVITQDFAPAHTHAALTRERLAADQTRSIAFQFRVDRTDHWTGLSQLNGEVQ